MHVTLPRTDLAVACLILCGWAVSLLVRHAGEWPIDLSAIWMASRLVWLGEWGELYGAPTRIFSYDFPLRWTAELAAVGHADKVALPYVYPPIWAWLLAPLGRLDPLAFFAGGQAILFACTAASALLIWRLARPSHMSATTYAVLFVALAETTIPFTFAARLAQPQMLLLLLVILAFERYAAGARRTAAVALGIAAALKVTPILLCLAFLADRDWRTPVQAVAVAAVFAVASFAVAGLAPHLAFVARVQEIEALVPMVGLNVTFESMMHMIFVPAEARAHLPHPFVGDNLGWISALNKAGLVLALAACLFAGRGLELHRRMLVRMVMLSLATTLFGPLSWMHYYMLPVMILPFLPGLIGPGRAVAVILPVLLLMWAPVRFIESGLVVLQGVYPTGYWLGFLLLFGALGLFARPRPARARASRDAEEAVPAE